MSFKIADILRLYRKLDGDAGFRIELREGRDTIAKVYCDGRPVLFTGVPHGKGTLDGKLVHYIRNQLKLNEDDFTNLIRCALSAAEYKEILKRKGFLG